MPRFSKDSEIHLEIDDEINDVFDEAPGSNSFLALRKLRWNEAASFKLDIRKWYVNSEGEEVAGKGVSFVTEQGPDNLIKALLSHGYGDTESIISTLSTRDDFPVIIKRQLEERGIDLDLVQVPTLDNVDATYYDPKSIIE